jgi:hypothetical protein
MKGKLVMKLRRNILCLIVVGLVFFFSNGLAFAQTPDGDTPSVELVCDGQVGAAFGLCNAYCEAMDCDYVTPQASEKACNKVLDRFTQLSGAMPPCEMEAMHCGNGVYEPDLGEECDDGNDDELFCTNTCTFAESD